MHLRYHRAYRTQGIHASLSTSSTSSIAPRYAVVGAGIAGIAVAWHLLHHHKHYQRPVHLDIFDAHGLGAGGSGAAAGLVHPFTPRGKLLWKGLEAYKDALRLIEVAETAATESGDPHFVWRYGLLRCATSSKQGMDFAKHIESNVNGNNSIADLTDTRCIYTIDELERLVPGIGHHFISPPGKVHGAAIGLFTGAGVVVKPGDYLATLWRCCQRASTWGSMVTFHQRTVPSLKELEGDLGPYDGIIVAAGAAVESVEELHAVFPLDLCQGYTLDMAPTSVDNTDQEYPLGAPSLLGSTYIAFHGQRNAVVGATQRHGASLAEALADLGPGSKRSVTDPVIQKDAIDALVPTATGMWTPLAKWQVTGVRSGHRALPVRTSQGSIPYAGQLSNFITEKESTVTVCNRNKNWWVVCGLGARGFVYHAWLGRHVADGVIAGSDADLPKELIRWKDTRRLHSEVHSF